MQLRSLFLLVCAILAGTAYVVGTIDDLPSRVATHFATDGRPDAWMSRNNYQAFALLFLYSLPLVQLLLVGLLPQRFPRLLNIPARDYWLAPERRAASLRFLWAQACTLAGLCVVLVAAVHYIILVAHRSIPPMLPTALFSGVLLGFLAACAAWVTVLLLRFRKPRS